MNRKIGVILSYVLIVFEILSTLLLTPFILRTLGQAEYGVYKLAAAINAYLLLLDLGVGNAITRFVAKYKAENNQIQGRRFLGVATIYYLGIAIVTTIIGTVLVVIFPSVFAKGLSAKEVLLGQRLLSITMINSAVTLGTAAYAKIIIAYEQFWISKGTSIVQIIVRMLFTILALKLGLGSIGIVIVNLVMTLFTRGFFVFYTIFRIKLVPLFKGIETSFVKEIFLYSSLILLQMIATQINNTVDQILIGAMVTSSSTILAVYGVGTQIVQYFQSMGTAFTGVLMPGIVRMISEDKSPKRILNEMVRISRILFMVLILILSGFIVNGKTFVCLWAGEANAQSYTVALLLMIAQLFVLSESVGTQILWAMNEHKEQAIMKLIVVVCNIGLTITLIQWNALFGATIGTFISIILGDVLVMNVIFYKKLHINLLEYYRRLFEGIVPCAGISIIIGCAVKYFYSNGVVALLFNAMIMCVTYATCMICFGANEYEKNLFFNIMKKFMKKSGGK